MSLSTAHRLVLPNQAQSNLVRARKLWGLHGHQRPACSTISEARYLKRFLQLLSLITQPLAVKPHLSPPNLARKPHDLLERQGVTLRNFILQGQYMKGRFPLAGGVFWRLGSAFKDFCFSVLGRRLWAIPGLRTLPSQENAHEAYWLQTRNCSDLRYPSSMSALGLTYDFQRCREAIERRWRKLS